MMDELKKVPTNKESGSDKPVGDAATTPVAASVSSGADTSPSTKASNKADCATENKELTTKIAQMMTACKKAADEGMDVLDNYDHAMEEGVAQGKLDSMLKELVNHEAECSRLNAQFSLGGRWSRSRRWRCAVRSMRSVATRPCGPRSMRPR